MSKQDNQYYPQGCPAMMSDGRIFSSYVSSQTLIDAIKRANNLDSCQFDNNDLRLWLQHNANNLMRKEHEYMVQNYQCRLPKRPIKIEMPFEN